MITQEANQVVNQILNPSEVVTTSPAHQQWLNNLQTQELISRIKLEREKIRVELDSGGVILEKKRLRGMCVESYTLDCVLSLIAGNAYLSSAEALKRKQQMISKEQMMQGRHLDNQIKY